MRTSAKPEQTIRPSPSPISPCPHSLPAPADIEVRPLLDAAAQVRNNGHAALRWEDWERYSNRQDRHMKLGGFTGDITYTDIPEILRPYLHWGSHLHVGKGSAFGLGWYELSNQ